MTQLLLRRLLVCMLGIASLGGSAAEPPAGFMPLFNGRDLAGWRGRPHFDPATESEGTAEERT